MAKQHHQRYQAASTACLAIAALCSAALAWFSAAVSLQVVATVATISCLIALTAHWVAASAPAPKPERIEIPVTRDLSISDYLDGLESLLGGEVNKLVSAPQQLKKNERDRLNRLTADIRRFVSNNQSLQAAVQRLERSQTVPIPSVESEPELLAGHHHRSQQQLLVQQSSQLEKMAAQLIAAADANEEHRDGVQEQLAALKLQTRKLADRSRAVTDTIELLKDLAEQSGVLALNTAIQASRSSETGLNVVADELQRVANRHADANRQLEASLLQLNNELVEANDLIDHGRHLLGKGQHDISQLRRHIGKLSRSCSELKTHALSATNHSREAS